MIFTHTFTRRLVVHRNVANISVKTCRAACAGKHEMSKGKLHKTRSIKSFSNAKNSEPFYYSWLTSGRLKRPSPERENQSLNLQALHKWRYHSGSGLRSCRNAIYTVWVVLYENWILKVTLPEKSVWDWSFLNCFFWEKGYVCHWLPGIITPLCPECAQGTKPGFGEFPPAPY